MTTIIDGKKIAASICDDLAIKVAALERKPTLAAIIVGDDPASHVYVNRKETQAKKIGITSKIFKLSTDTPQNVLLSLIGVLNSDPDVDGILVQLPLPNHMNQDWVLEAVDPAKDVDGFHPMNSGRLGAGTPKMVPCTPKGIMRLLEASGTVLKGATALVIGRSAIVGLPTALLLNRADATVTIAHRETRNTAYLCSQADILVAAVGRPEMIRAHHIKRGATIIDVGINKLPDGRIVGDVAYHECLGIANAITPVPGGVGPMTIACLMENTYQAAISRT